MSKNAPDTRNKLDSNKDLNKKSYNKGKKVNKNPLNLQEFKKVIENFSEKKISENKPKLTKGQLFKKNFGFSKSVARAMRKAGIVVPKVIEGYGIEVTYALEDYRKIRNSRKEALKELRQKKHSDSVAFKRHNGKGKSKKAEPKKKN